MLAALQGSSLISLFPIFFSPKGALPKEPEAKAEAKSEPKPEEKAKTTAKDSPKSEALEAEIRRCRLTIGKATAVNFCISEAKRWHAYRLKHPEPPKAPPTALERELSRCETLSKPGVVLMCKREAPAKVEQARKDAEARAAAEAADKRTPLEKAIARCRNQSFSKAAQTHQCIQDAKRSFQPKP